MRPASFKEIETYLYTSIVLPLKGLSVQELRYPSPLVGNDGERWELQAVLTPTRLNYRRNYQRTQAERRRNWWIIVKIGEREHRRTLVLGEYHNKYHTVKLYQQAFSELDAIPLMGKMLDVLQTNSPFTKVTVESGEYPEFERDGYSSPRSLRYDQPDIDEAFDNSEDEDVWQGEPAETPF